MTAGSVVGIVVAAGRGERFGATTPKALLDLGGTPLVGHAARALLSAGAMPVVVVAPAEHLDAVRTAVNSAVGDGCSGGSISVVPGGASRQASVASGLQALPADARWVLVHDAARPLSPVELATAVIDALRAGADAVVPGLPVTDTIKAVDGRTVTATLDRDRLVAAQTPQGFAVDVLRRAHDRAAPEGAGALDDASLVEIAGGVVHVVPGSPRALKITRPLDLAIAEKLLDSNGF